MVSLRTPDYRWRVLRPGASSVPEDIASHREGEALWNMAFDSVLSEWNTTDTLLPTLRLYYWDRPAVTLGRFQNAERTVYSDNCNCLDIPVVRRVTGGRGILHGDDLTFSVTCSIRDLGLVSHEALRLTSLYARLSAVFISAFAAVGVTCSTGDVPVSRGNPDRGDCFASATAADIVERTSSRKLLGTALHRSEHLVLQQGTIPLRPTRYASAIALFRGDVPSQSNNRAGVNYDGNKLSLALIDALEDHFGASVVSDLATESEVLRTRVRVMERLTNPLWNLRVQGQPEGLD